MDAAATEPRSGWISIPDIGQVYQPEFYTFKGKIVQVQSGQESDFISIPENHIFMRDTDEKSLVVWYPLNEAYRAIITGQKWSYVADKKRGLGLRICKHYVNVTIDKDGSCRNSIAVDERDCLAIENIDTSSSEKTDYKFRNMNFVIDFVALRKVRDEIFCVQSKK